MSQALLKAVANCGRCIQYEAKGQLPPMQPIICTEPMELVHIDYVRMEVTIVTDKKPIVRYVLVDGILWKSHCGHVQPAGCRKDPYDPVSPADQWISRESTPDTTMHDRQT